MLGVLLKKNALLRRRTPRATLCELLYPVIVVGILIGMFYTIVSAGQQDTELDDTADYTLRELPSLDDSIFTEDRRLLYTPGTHTEARQLMERLKKKAKVPLEGFGTEEEMVTYAQRQVIHVWAGVVFHLTDEQRTSGRFFTSGEPGAVNYSIRLDPTFLELDTGDTHDWSVRRNKKSDSEMAYRGEGILSLEAAVDQEFLRLSTEDTDAVLNILTQRFPVGGKPIERPKRIDLVRKNLKHIFPIVCLLALLFSVYRLLADIVTEKQTRIRETMMMMGLQQSMYWISWFITVFGILVGPIAVYSILFKYTQIYKESDLLIIMVLNFAFACSLISFSFLVSVFVNNAKFAGPVGTLMLLVIDIGGVFVETSDMSDSLKKLFSLLSPIAFNIGNTFIVGKESSHEGAQWDNIKSTDLSYATCLGMLILDTILYLMLAWYADHVVPGEYGTRKPLLFPFMPSYWRSIRVTRTKGKGSTAIPLLSTADVSEDVEVQDMGDRVCSINTRGLRKVFSNGTVAIDSLDLDIFEGQITALLGHNGAGKTTLISVLTGLLPPTTGDASVGGFSIQGEMSDVRRTLGVCPQHDVIWPTLSVREHLSIFAGLKGVSWGQITQTTNAMIEEMELGEKASSAAGTLSGGQKRKLCLGIALIGGSKVVFCDEPTSGMDPVSRRSVWRVLEQNKQGRTIVLTTHFMDEADILGDRVAIMSKGRMRAAGTSLFLKARFGTGYSLHFTRAEGSQERTITDFVKGHVRDATLISQVATELAYRLPRQAVDLFPSLFAELEERGKDLGIVSYGMSLTTMEDVFLRLNEESLESPDVEGTLGAPLEEREETTRRESVRLRQELANKANRLHCLQVKAVHPSIWRQWLALTVKRAKISMRDLRNLVFQFVIPLACVIAGIALLHSLESDTVDKPPLPLLPLPDMFGSDNLTPYDGVAGGDDLVQEMEGYTEEDTFRVASVADWVQEDTHQNAGGAFGFEAVSANLYNVSVFYNVSWVHSLPAHVHGIDDAVLRMASGGIERSIYTTIDPFPPGALGYALVNINAHMALVLLWMFGFSIVSAGVSMFVVLEREEKLKYLQLTNGASKLVYWLSTLAWDLTAYYVLVCACIVVLAAWGFGEDYNQGIEGMTLLLLLYGPCSFLLTYVLSFNFRRYSTAQGALAALYFFVAYTFVGPILSVGIVLGPDHIATRIMNIMFSAICPTYGLSLGLMKVVDFVGFRSQVGLSDDASIFENKLLGMQCLILALQIAVYAVILFVMDMRQEIKGFFMWLLGRSIRRRRAYRKNGVMDATDEEANGEGMGDEDVQTEDARVGQRRAEDDAVIFRNTRKVFLPVLPQDDVKVAVSNVALGIPFGECFGLLGHNGAGKTTLLNMFSGELEPTEGTVSVCGHDILLAPRQAKQTIGLCPQFDHLWDRLSGREHLRMYAHLKGVPRREVETTVASFIDMTGLGPYADKWAGGYSGGNKRKLSLAIALIGDPPVVALDEPSTGMDPVARRHMWNLISSVREVSERKAIILTTHSMEECDVLATRVGIMKKGELVCLGGTQHLKSKYGSGYNIEIMGRELAGMAAIRDFVTRVFPRAQVLEEHGLMLGFEVPQEGLSLARIFGELQSHKGELGIRDYSVSQPTLEQIFLQLTKEKEGDEPATYKPPPVTIRDVCIGYTYILLSSLVPGIHHFWLRNYGRGILWALTYNLIGLGWIYDIFYMPSLIKQCKQQRGKVGWCHPCCCCAKGN